MEERIQEIINKWRRDLEMNSENIAAFLKVAPLLSDEILEPRFATLYAERSAILVCLSDVYDLLSYVRKSQPTAGG